MQIRIREDFCVGTMGSHGDRFQWLRGGAVGTGSVAAGDEPWGQVPWLRGVSHNE